MVELLPLKVYLFTFKPEALFLMYVTHFFSGTFIKMAMFSIMYKCVYCYEVSRSASHVSMYLLDQMSQLYKRGYGMYISSRRFTNTLIHSDVSVVGGGWLNIYFIPLINLCYGAIQVYNQTVQ